MSHPSARSDSTPESGSRRATTIGPTNGTDARWLLATARGIVRGRAFGWPEEERNDLASEAVVRYLRFTRRQRADQPAALLATIVDRVWKDALRHRQVERRYFVDGEEDTQKTVSDPAAHLAVAAVLEREERARLRTAVLLLFERADARCHQLARCFFAERAWSDVAAETAESAEAIRQHWSRKCLGMLRERMRSDDGFLGRALRAEAGS